MSPAEEKCLDFQAAHSYVPLRSRWDPVLPPWLAGDQRGAAASAGDAGIPEQPVPRPAR